MVQLRHISLSTVMWAVGATRKSMVSIRSSKLTGNPDREVNTLTTLAPHRPQVPSDPSTATELTPALRDRLAAAARPPLAKIIAAMEPGFPLWDEIAAAVWLDRSLIIQQETLFADCNTLFSAGYGDLLTWRAGYQPGLGEQRAAIVRAIDPARLEALMLAVIAGGASGQPLGH